MDSIKFLEKLNLNADQLKVALKVIDEAERQGVNPSFVLPLVMAESQFKHSAISPVGATGVMQLMPKTAKGLGVDPSNEDENISGGIKLIKQLTQDKRVGNDPYKLLVRYNSRSDTPYWKTDNPQDLPEETKTYLTRIHELNDGDLPSPLMAKGEEQPKVKNENNSQYGDTKISTKSEPSEKENDDSLQTAGSLGALGGALIGGFKAPAIGAVHRLSKILGGNISPQDAAKILATLERNNAGVSGAGSVGSGDAKQAPPMGLNDAGRMAKGQTGAYVYNSAKAAGLTDIEAARALDVTKQKGGVHDLLTQRRESTNKIQDLFPTETYGENPRYGGLVTPITSVGGKKTTYVNRPPVIENGVVVNEGGLEALPPRQKINTNISGPGVVSRALAGVASSNPVMGGLAGFNAAYNAQDAWNQDKEGNVPSAVASGIGSLADVATLIPRSAPIAGAISSSVDANRRFQNKDYTGALASTLGAVAPYAAPFLFGPEVGIPVGIATALGMPVANEMRDLPQWLTKKILDYTTPDAWEQLNKPKSSTK